MLAPLQPPARSAHAFRCVLALAFVGCTAQIPPSIPNPYAGRLAPAFEAVSLDNRLITVPSNIGAKAIVIDFWASWCGSCQATMPALERVWRDRYSKGLIVVGVSVDDDAQQALNGARALGVTFPIVHDQGQQLQSAYGVGQIPTTFVVDSSGYIRFVGRDPESIKRAVVALMDR